MSASCFAPWCGIDGRYANPGVCNAPGGHAYHDRGVDPSFRATPVPPGAGVVYVGGPIERFGEMVRPASGSFQRVNPGVVAALAQYTHDRGDLVDRLRSAGFECHVAWETGNSAEAEAANAAALSSCAAMVGLLPELVPTIGVPIELAASAASGRPTIAVTPVRSRTLERLGVVRVDFVEDAIEALGAMLAPDVRLDGRDDRAEGRTLPFTLNDGAKGWAVPTRHYADDAALDLFVTEAKSIPPRGFADVEAGCRVQLAEGTFGLILGRSSAMRKRQILVVTGVIDVGYRGDLFVGCYNITEGTQTVRVGDRIGQLVILPNLTKDYDPTVVDRLDDHPRGESGFGSTGGYDGNGLDRTQIGSRLDWVP